MKGIFLAFAASLAAMTGSVQAQQERQSGVLVDALNRCLSVPGASFAECAGIAGSVAKRRSVKVTHEFDFTGAHDGSRPPTGSIEVECNGSGLSCWVVDCEDDSDGSGMTLCSFIAECKEDDQLGQTVCG